MRHLYETRLSLQPDRQTLFLELVIPYLSYSGGMAGVLSGDLTSVAVFNPIVHTLSSLVWGMTCRSACSSHLVCFFVCVQKGNLLPNCWCDFLFGNALTNVCRLKFYLHFLIAKHYFTYYLTYIYNI